MYCEPADRKRRKLRTKRGRERYALRMETAEPVFGQIKQGRAGHNLLKLCRFGAGGSGRGRGNRSTRNNKESAGAATCGIFRLLPAYTCPRRSEMIAVGWSQLNPCQSGIPRTGC